MGELYSFDAAATELRNGRDFHGRIQQAMESLDHWRSLLIIALSGVEGDKWETDRLADELTICQTLIHELAENAEWLKEMRGG